MPERFGVSEEVVHFDPFSDEFFNDPKVVDSLDDTRMHPRDGGQRPQHIVDHEAAFDTDPWIVGEFGKGYPLALGEAMVWR